MLVKTRTLAHLTVLQFSRVSSRTRFGAFNTFSLIVLRSVPLGTIVPHGVYNLYYKTVSKH